MAMPRGCLGPPQTSSGGPTPGGSLPGAGGKTLSIAGWERCQHLPCSSLNRIIWASPQGCREKGSACSCCPIFFLKPSSPLHRHHSRQPAANCDATRAAGAQLQHQSLPSCPKNRGSRKRAMGTELISLNASLERAASPRPLPAHGKLWPQDAFFGGQLQSEKGSQVLLPCRRSHENF